MIDKPDLFKAYWDAVDARNHDLAKEIMKQIGEKHHAKTAEKDARWWSKNMRWQEI